MVLQVIQENGPKRLPASVEERFGKMCPKHAIAVIVKFGNFVRGDHLLILREIPSAALYANVVDFVYHVVGIALPARAKTSASTLLFSRNCL